jgi:hypothetical protein
LCLNSIHFRDDWSTMVAVKQRDRHVGRWNNQELGSIKMAKLENAIFADDRRPAGRSRRTDGPVMGKDQIRPWFTQGTPKKDR